VRARDLAPSRTVFVAANTSVAHCDPGCGSANTRLSPVTAGCLRPDLRVCGSCGEGRLTRTSEVLADMAPEDLGLSGMGDRDFL
jgi:hypothetical protein